MRVAFLMGSSIDVNPQFQLKNSIKVPVRIAHTREERLRHTLFGITQILNEFPKAEIFLLEASTDSEWVEKELKKQFVYMNSDFIHIISLKDIDPEINNTVITHPHKTYCEMLLFTTFIQAYKEKLSEYDFLFKISGRYQIYFGNEKNLDPTKMYFKSPLVFQWDDKWGYNLVDLRKETGDNNLLQYPSIIFGWGKEHFHKITDIMEYMKHATSTPELMHYDIETLLYYLTRPFKDQIVETNWKITGFTGQSNNFHWY